MRSFYLPLAGYLDTNDLERRTILSQDKSKADTAKVKDTLHSLLTLT